MKDLEKNLVDIYRNQFEKHKDSPLSTFQNDRTTQSLRFGRLLKNLNIQSADTLLDVGCGLGDLYGFLKQESIDCQYVGLDPVSEMIDFGKTKFPSAGFQTGTLDAFTGLTDWAVSSGLFNLPGTASEPEWRDFTLQTIVKMYEKSRKGVSFNLLSSHRTFSDPTLHYWDPSEILFWCVDNLSRFVAIDLSYPLYEITVTVTKKTEVATQNPAPELEKYF